MTDSDELLRLVRRIDHRVRLIGELVGGIGAIATGALVFAVAYFGFSSPIWLAALLAIVIAGALNTAMRWDLNKGPRVD